MTEKSTITGGGASRRALVGGVVGLGVGVPLLAACGSDDRSDSSAGGSSGGSSDSGSSGGGTTSSGGIATTSEVPVGGGKIFPGEKVVVTQPTEGDFKAFSAVCTHQACLVSGVADGTINCACHGSKYDISTGAVKQGPATTALPEKTVTVSGDGISVT